MEIMLFYANLIFYIVIWVCMYVCEDERMDVLCWMKCMGSSKMKGIREKQEKIEKRKGRREMQRKWEYVS